MPRGQSDTESRQYYEAYEEFYKSLKDQSALRHFQPFFQSIQAVEAEISRLHRRDRFGRLPLLNAEARRNLLTLHESLGREAEKLIAGGQINEAQKDMVRKISGLASRNYRHLNGYDPAEPRRLNEILEDARTLTLDTRGLQLNDTVGSVQNKRQPLTFLDDKGRKVTGVFTPKTELRIWESWDQQIKKLAEETGGLKSDAKELLTNFMTKLDSEDAAHFLGLPLNASHGDRVAALYHKVGQNYWPDKPAGALCECIAQVSSDYERSFSAKDVKRMLGPEALKGLLTMIVRDNPKIINNFIGPKIHDGARLDNRNAAMSAVAELLNVPNLLAKSVPMKVVTGTDKNGKPIVSEGTFMLAAKGVDSTNLREAEAKYGRDSLRDLDGNVMKSIADLQVLDFICGNTDRHGGNVLYQFDEKTKKLIGIQGIDNDNAFGTLVPQSDRDFVGHLVTQNNLRMISSGMYERLKNLTPETLKFSLRGYGLTEEELNAAVKRMDIVKKAVEKDLDYFENRDRAQAAKEKNAAQAGKEAEQAGKKENTPYTERGRLRVVPEEKWKSVNWDELQGKHSFTWYKDGKPKDEFQYDNMFHRVFDRVSRFGDRYKQQQKQYSALESKVVIGSGNRTNPEAIGEELKRARDLETLLAGRTEEGRTSQNYINMQKAVTNYRENLETLSERLKNADPKKPVDLDHPEKAFDGIVTVEDLSEMHRLGKEVREAAQTYLGGKNLFLPHLSYAQNRINAAKAAVEFGKSAAATEEEIQIASRNEHQAQERVQDSLGNRLEQEAKRPAPAPAP